MRLLHYLLVLAVVLGANLVAAQDSDRSQSPRLPWWKLSDDGASHGEPQDKDDAGKPPKAQPDTDNLLDRLEFFDQIRAARGTTPAPATPSPTSDKQPFPKDPAFARQEPRERLVYRLSNAPSLDVVNTITKLLTSEQAADGDSAPAYTTVVLADPLSNSLIISGSSAQIHETVQLAEQLDQPPALVSVHVVLAAVQSKEGLVLLDRNPEGPVLSCSYEEACQLADNLKTIEGVEILAQPQIITLDNQPAFVQIGQRVPRVDLRSTKDGQIMATEMENVGLIVGVTPRIAPDNVVTMEIDVEKSELGSESLGVPIGVDAHGNVIRTPRIQVLTAQTTVRIPAGRAVVVSGLVAKDDHGLGELVMIVSPHVVKKGEE